MRIVLLENKYQDTSGFGRVPDPPEPPDCSAEDYNEDDCRFCSNRDDCKKEWEEYYKESEDEDEYVDEAVD